MRKFFLRAFIPCMFCVCFIGTGDLCVATAEVTLQSMLNEMIDPAALARLPMPAYKCGQASSYDRATKTPSDPAGWFANSDWSQFIRSEEHGNRREWVMMDVDGPGAVVRFWTGGQPAIGNIRFYLDGAPEPALVAPMQKLFTGKNAVPHPLAIENPKEAGNLYLPIPYARHCTITYEQTDPNNPAAPPGGRWYNVEYRTYAAGTDVRTFTMADLEASQAPVEQVRQALLARCAPVETANRTNRVVLAGPAAVGNVSIRLAAEDMTAALRSTVITMECDGEQTVWCPVGDFFGSAAGLTPYGDWRRSVQTNGWMSSAWVMPFRQTCTIAVTNLGPQSVEVDLNVVRTKWSWDSRSMHFHANWRQQYPLPTQPRSDWNYITASGQGVYIGDTLSVYNPVKDWWGEGDEKIWVDGESFPSHIGTGSEDYYGYAWGDTRLFQGPFSSQVRCDGPGNKGYTVVTRTRSLDAIPFTKSLKMDMEVWHWKPCSVGYAATTYWYASPGATSDRGPEPAEAVRAIP